MDPILWSVLACVFLLAVAVWLIFGPNPDRQCPCDHNWIYQGSGYDPMTMTGDAEMALYMCEVCGEEKIERYGS